MYLLLCFYNWLFESYSALNSVQFDGLNISVWQKPLNNHSQWFDQLEIQLVSIKKAIYKSLRPSQEAWKISLIGSWKGIHNSVCWQKEMQISKIWFSCQRINLDPMFNYFWILVWIGFVNNTLFRITFISTHFVKSWYNPEIIS